MMPHKKIVKNYYVFFINNYIIEFQKICINKIPNIIKLIPIMSTKDSLCPSNTQLLNAINMTLSPDQTA